jgi:alcohol dehydrogenase
MRALVSDSGLHLDESFPEPVRTSGEALLRLRLGGICNTDLELLRGYMAFRGVLGHEFVADVLEADDPAWVGRRVVGDINAACYACPACLAGRHTHCPHRTTLGIYGRDGAFAERFLLPQANLVAVPDSVPDEAAVFAEPLAAACEVLEQLTLRPSDRVVVLGDGKLGLLVAAVLRLTGADLTLVGRHQGSLALAHDFGAAVRLSIGAVGELDDLRGADVVVECTGQPSGFAEAASLLRPRGVLVLKSTYHGEPSVDLSALVVNEVTLLGSRCGPFAPAMRLLAAGLVHPQSMILATYTLAEGETAFARAAMHGALKILLRP